MLDIPDPVRRKAVLADATPWLDDLPELIASLEVQWAITVGRVYPDATEAVVAQAVRHDDTPAVLKLGIPRAMVDLRDEITVLRLADGHGCARLLEADPDRAALLLERLGPSMHDLALPFDQRLPLLCDLAAQVWRPAAGSGLPTGAWKAQWLIDYVAEQWQVLDRPCSERAVDHAIACAEQRRAAHDDERARLVHGDVHEWNALQKGVGFALVDPDGLLAEPEYDLGVLMREDPVELMAGNPRRRAAYLAARTGRDAEAVWQWGVVERVSTGLVATSIGLQPIGRHLLEAADAIAAEAIAAG